MPRNHSSGSYSTPAGQPVISGTVISAATENALVSDLANEMSDSLSRAGYGGMNAPIRTPDGAVNAPAHSFTSETGTGIYRIGASDVGLAISGVKTHEWTASGETVTGDETVTGNLSVQGATGATVTTGNIGLSASGAQNITKTGTGNLWLQSGAGQHIEVNPGAVSTFIFNGTDGLLHSDGTHGVTGLPTPSNSSDAATKGYVDGGGAYVAKAWAYLTIGAAGAVTVTAGHGVSSASWSTNILSVNLSPAMGSSTYAVFATTATLQIMLAVGLSSSSLFYVDKTNSAGSVNWSNGEYVSVLVFSG